MAPLRLLILLATLRLQLGAHDLLREVGEADEELVELGSEKHGELTRRLRLDLRRRIAAVEELLTKEVAARET